MGGFLVGFILIGPIHTKSFLSWQKPSWMIDVQNNHCELKDGSESAACALQYITYDDGQGIKHVKTPFMGNCVSLWGVNSRGETDSGEFLRKYAKFVRPNHNKRENQLTVSAIDRTSCDEYSASIEGKE